VWGAVFDVKHDLVARHLIDVAVRKTGCRYGFAVI
jgi:hypothetical protein